METTTGRISKAAFVGSSSAFLGICLITVVFRCYIRFCIQREIGWDDGFLIFGLCCLIVGMTLLFTVIDTMYESENFVFGSGIATINPMEIPNLLNRIAHYRTMSAVALMLMWLSMGCVKICFLAFFKKLIRQMPAMNIFWWFSLVFNAAVIVYGTTTYYVTCPYFGPEKVFQSMQCVQGSGLKLALSFSISQMALDIIGDIFILVIPVVLIWKIRITWKQKLALAFTLCLTIVMVIITIARIAGLKWRGKLDSIWETYFIVIAAEIGLSLVAVSAFRALYVSKSKDRHVNKTITSFRWYNKGHAAVWNIITKTTGKTTSVEMQKRGDGFLKDDIPHGTMTGMRTFIDANGRTRIYDTMDEERSMDYSSVSEQRGGPNV
ncbi:uncharacterized protein N0V89_009299 [Didymosphaeria variabile]|uniref:Rhodopsin domain-containing protein n=1 Tax=Didymosphaeria variabile TaxID=1932322 RepID=A0A9W8XDJ3_9PLEO|nr:uncharacterized protein N0V89_009299 [Didymosphaeria variabile]KAJ4347927.1 hypothetical protein N0V89_009299 [Didymosphaeria variabile]